MNFSNRAWPDWVPRLLWIRHECPWCNSLKFKQAELRPLIACSACLRCSRFVACFAGADAIGWDSVGRICPRSSALEAALRAVVACVPLFS